MDIVERLNFSSDVNVRDAAAEINRLREELDVTNKLLEQRERVLRAIPECPVHGAGCVPHALDWIDRAKAAPAPNDDLVCAWSAACAFIDAHVADPDMTDEMVRTYAEFQKWRAHLKTPNVLVSGADRRPLDRRVMGPVPKREDR